MTVAPRVRRHANVAPASPVKLHDGASELPGEVGPDVTVGAAGAVESSTYVIELDEHGDVFPAKSVAVACNELVVSSATVAVRPAASSDAYPDATGPAGQP